ncbi:hypothetical protein ACFYRY_38930 [Streptomyces sp. NPDC005263]|uniref:hypothetical protein n=1 Tax=Streptomyces sp. NPDC005263 TaxID=3364711 RepID=UPI00367E80A7
MRTLMPPPVAGRLGVTALTVLTAAGATWLATPTAAAVTGPDILIHDVRTPYGSATDDLVVCRFRLDAVGFPTTANTTVGYTITAQVPPSAVTTTGTIPLNNGAGQSNPIELPDGQYVLTWPTPPGTVTTPPNQQKVFQVDCDEERKHGKAHGPGGHSYEDPSGEKGEPGGYESEKPGGYESEKPSGYESEKPKEEAAWGEHESGGPKGGVHAGGGGLADTAQAYTPLSAAAGVGLVAVSGAVYFRLLRRRSHGAA